MTGINITTINKKNGKCIVLENMWKIKDKLIFNAIYNFIFIINIIHNNQIKKHTI